MQKIDRDRSGLYLRHIHLTHSKILQNYRNDAVKQTVLHGFHAYLKDIISLQIVVFLILLIIIINHNDARLKDSALGAIQKSRMGRP